MIKLKKFESGFKRSLSLILVISTILTTFAVLFPVQSSAEESDYYTYRISNGNAIITDVNPNISGDINIPPKLGGYPVTELGNYSFRDCEKITGITMPNSVTNIGVSAFGNCYSLTSITISSGVTSIDYQAFLNCNSLKTITVDSQNKKFSSLNGTLYNKDKSVLFSCPAGTNGNYIIPNTVSNIGKYAFYNCTNLTSIKIQSSVSSIGEHSFSNCISLTNIEIPNTVTSIGSSAFSGCTGLTSIIIPNSVTSIGSCTFSGCIGLTGIIIPDSVTSLGYGAFSNCTGLTSIEIPNSVTYIGDSAFSNTNITTIKIPNSVTYIDRNPFWNCLYLTDIIVDEQNMNFSSDNGVLYNKDKTNLILCPHGKSGTYNIPNSVNNIENNAFSYCKKIENISIPNSVTAIGYSAFISCSSLTNIDIPNSIERIDMDTFAECKSLKSITIPEGVTMLDWNSFRDCTSLETVVMPSTITFIMCDAFYGCSSLNEIIVDVKNTDYSSLDGILYDANKSTLVLCPAGKTGTISIPDSVTTIGDYSFRACTGLTNLNIPNSVSDIGYGAFSDCSSLISIDIPDNVTSIYSGLFMNCNSLTSVTIPKSVTFIDADAFYGCTSLTEFIIDNQNQNYTSLEGIIYNYDKSSIILCPVGKIGTIYIPNTVITINDYAFRDCKNLTGIIIPDSVTSLGYGVFSNCTGLISIDIPNSVTTMQSYIFRECTGLTTVNLPDSITKISDSAFFSCKSLTNIDIPNSVTSIDDFAFYSCDNLVNVTIPNSLTNIGSRAFYDCKKLTCVNYSGTSSQWSKINIKSGNDYLTNDIINYNSGTTEKILSSISIYTKPTKANYYVGDSIDTTGLKLKLTYSDNSTEYVTSGFTISGFSSSTIGTKTITVNYSGKKTTFNVTVNEKIKMLSSICVYTQPTKILYYVGDSFDTTGLKLKLTYNDNSTEYITNGFTTSGFDSTTTGIKIITVTYADKSTTFGVVIKEKSSESSTTGGNVLPSTNYKFVVTDVNTNKPIKNVVIRCDDMLGGITNDYGEATVCVLADTNSKLNFKSDSYKTYTTNSALCNIDGVNYISLSKEIAMDIDDIYYTDLFYYYPSYLENNNYIKEYFDDTEKVYDDVYSHYEHSLQIVGTGVETALSTITSPTAFTTFITDNLGLTDFSYKDALDTANQKIASNILSDSTCLEIGEGVGNSKKVIDKIKDVVDVFDNISTLLTDEDEAEKDDEGEAIVQDSSYYLRWALRELFNKTKLSNITDEVIGEIYLEIVDKKISLSDCFDIATTELEIAESIFVALALEDLRIELVDEIINSQTSNTVLKEGMLRLKKQLQTNIAHTVVTNYIESKTIGELKKCVDKFIMEWAMGGKLPAAQFNAFIALTKFVVFDILVDVPSYSDVLTLQVLRVYSQDLTSVVKSNLNSFDGDVLYSNEIIRFEDRFNFLCAINKTLLECLQNMADKKTLYKDVYELVKEANANHKETVEFAFGSYLIETIPSSYSEQELNSYLDTFISKVDNIKLGLYLLTSITTGATVHPMLKLNNINIDNGIRKDEVNLEAIKCYNAICDGVDTSQNVIQNYNKLYKNEDIYQKFIDNVKKDIISTPVEQRNHLSESVYSKYTYTFTANTNVLPASNDTLVKDSIYMVNGYVLGNVQGTISIPKDSKIGIDGNVKISWEDIINDGELTITKNLTVGWCCNITNNGILNVYGKFDASNPALSHITNWNTMRVGDIDINVSSSINFWFSNNYKIYISRTCVANESRYFGGEVIFVGETQQTVSGLSANNITVLNNFGIKYLSDIKVYGKYYLNNNPLYCNGYTTKAYNDARFDNSNYYSIEAFDLKLRDNIKANITGSFTVPSKSIVKIDGNVNISFDDITNYGELTITKNLSFGWYCGILNNGILKVNGNFDASNSASASITNKNTMYIGGDFNTNVSSVTSFYFNENYKLYVAKNLITNYNRHISGEVIFNGESQQNVSGLSTDRVTITNKSSFGIVFDTKLKVSTLFNHNGNKFTLKSGGTFVDYDCDGINDDIDKFPTIFGDSYSTFIDKNDVEWAYNIRNKNAVLLKCFSINNKIEIPLEINGYKVTEIGSATFSDNKLLSEIIISDNINKISENAFLECCNLNNIYYEGTSAQWNSIIKEKGNTPIHTANIIYTIDGYIYSLSNDKATIVEYLYKTNSDIVIPNKLGDYTVVAIGDNIFENCTSLNSITIPNTVNSIGAYAFSNCTNLISLRLSNNITSIGDMSFSGCTRLTNIELPNSVNYIGYGAFLDCTSLISLEIPKGVTSIESDIFGGCTGLTKVEIPDTVTTIGNMAFRGCTGLTNIELPNSVNYIGYGAFLDCTSLTSLEILKGVTSIEGDTFGGCTGLTNIEIPDTVTTIGDMAFRGCTGLTNIELPNSVNYIGYGAFLDCTSLTSLEIPKGVTSIESDTFGGCTVLTNVAIPDTVTTIGYMVFRDCTELTTITIPSAVTSIGYGLFLNCNSLSSIIIPSSIKYIEYDAFNGCTSLTDIYYSGSQDEWESINIDGNNQSLNNATIHYNCEPVKIGSDSTPFNTNTSGYRFANSYSAFGYKNGDKISENIYVDVYGETYRKLYKSAEKWNGNCFGMAVTAILMNEGIIDKTQYTNSTVNADIYDGLNSSGYTISKNNEICKLIEHYQVWQNSKEWNSIKNDSIIFSNVNGNTNGTSIKTVLENFDNYLVEIQLDSWGAHTLVVDSSKVPEDLGDGWYRIWIYNPNIPYTGNNTDDVQSCYIDVNVYNNSYKVKGLTNLNTGTVVDIGYNDDGSFINGSSIYFINFDKLNTTFDGNAKIYAGLDTNVYMNLSCANYTIYNSNNDIVFKVENNTIVLQEDCIQFSVSRKSTTQTNTDLSGSIVLPMDTYSIDFDTQGTAQVFNGDYVVGLVSDGNTTVNVDEQSKVTTSGDNDTKVNVVVERIYNDNEFTTIDYTVTNDGINNTEVILDTNNNIAVNGTEETYDIKVYSNTFTNEMLLTNITNDSVQSTNIKEYATNNGQIVPNQISNANINYEQIITYDGNSHTVNPIITYQDKILEKDIDYVISGANTSTNAGKYIFTVTGIGKFAGVVELEYSILNSLKFKGASLILQNNIAVNYAVDKSYFETDGYTSPHVVFNMNGSETIVSNYTIKDNYYVFTFSNISPQMMNDTIIATLKAIYNGKEYSSESVEYSVAKYCYNKLDDKDSTDELKTLVVDLLNYGSMAQEYVNYNITNLANAKLTDVQKSLATDDSKVSNLISVTDKNYVDDSHLSISNAEVTWKGANLNLKDSISIQCLFDVDNIKDLTIQVTNLNGDVVKVISDNQLVKTDSGYVVKFNGLTSIQLSDSYYFTAYRNGECVSNTLRYSVESYACSMKNSNNISLKNLTNAIMKYGYSAKVYANLI